MTPQDPKIDELEGRGLGAALFFVDGHREEWPRQGAEEAMDMRAGPQDTKPFFEVSGLRRTEG